MAQDLSLKIHDASVESVPKILDEPKEEKIVLGTDTKFEALLSEAYECYSKRINRSEDNLFQALKKEYIKQWGNSELYKKRANKDS